MTVTNYSGVKALIAIDNPVLSKGLNEALRRLGFTDLVSAGKLASFQNALAERTFDLILMTSDLEGSFVGQAIADMRNGRLGEHPFAIVIMLLAAADQTYIRRVIDCGPDDLLLLPVSPKQLLGRIEALTRSRKPFVVTQDFIGPDRRKEQRPGGNSARLIEIPNPLKARTTDLPVEVLRGQIAKALDVLNVQKLDCACAQILWLKDAMAEAVRGDDAGQLRSFALKLQQMAGDVVNHLPKSGSADPARLAADLAAQAGAVGASGKTVDGPQVSALMALCEQTAEAVKLHLSQRPS